MSACTVEEVGGSGGGLLYCDSQGTTQGPECNGADASCSSGGGGGGGGGSVPPPGVGGTTCILPISTMGYGCPSDCNQCIFVRDLPPSGEGGGGRGI